MLAHKVDQGAASFFTSGLSAADPDVFASVQRELKRQQDQIELIASENIVSRAVLEAHGDGPGRGRAPDARQPG
jgi:hypothetical protein